MPKTCRHTFLSIGIDMANCTRYNCKCHVFKNNETKNKDGSYTEYYQLAHNTRHPKTKNPVPRVIHSFGRADQLDRDALVRLCCSIARVCDLEIVDLKEAARSNQMKGLGAGDLGDSPDVRLNSSRKEAAFSLPRATSTRISVSIIIVSDIPWFPLPASQIANP